FPLHIPPQADARRACVREGQIHPAVFIEIQSHHADSGRYLLFVEIDAVKRREFPFSGIEIDGSSRLSASDDEIHCAVIIEIGGDDASACSRKTDRRLRAYI